MKVCGVVKVSDADENKSRSKEKAMFLLYIFANSVQNCKDEVTAENESEIIAGYQMKVKIGKIVYSLTNKHKACTGLVGDYFTYSIIDGTIHYLL